MVIRALDMALTLGEKQRLFTRLVAKLIDWAYEHGYELTFGEAYRTPEQCEWNVQKGSGILNSLHADKLAIDFNLFIGGKYQTSSEAHKPLGEYWESLDPLCRWGGRFGDGNHYSVTHNGRK